MGRAIAHGTTSLSSFDDPTALALLPEDARARVNSIRSGAAPKEVRERLQRAHLQRLSHAMAVRTVAIDDAIRASATPQVVILGAGLDGRAWRMPTLANSVVFEVDTPDTQADKRTRVGGLASAARDIRFVPVDFTRDSLDDALAQAGHDERVATTWVWEGVVMYLTPSDIETTLADIARRSAAGSWLIVAYHRPAFLLRFLAPMLRRMGEPLRSAFTAEQMDAMLRTHGFSVVRDETLSKIGSVMPGATGRAVRRLTHFSIAIAAGGTK
jgi:methyltransferase (TIGR00027 family)